MTYKAGGAAPNLLGISGWYLGGINPLPPGPPVGTPISITYAVPDSNSFPIFPDPLDAYRDAILSAENYLISQGLNTANFFIVHHQFLEGTPGKYFCVLVFGVSQETVGTPYPAPPSPSSYTP